MRASCRCVLKDVFIFQRQKRRVLLKILQKQRVGLDLNLNVSSFQSHEHPTKDFSKRFVGTVQILVPVRLHTDLLWTALSCSFMDLELLKNVFLRFLLQICNVCVLFLARLITKNHPVVSKCSVQRIYHSALWQFLQLLH